MAGNARREIVDPDEVGVYHCWSKCVRDEFLCGEDHLRGKNFEHRKVWIEERQELLLRAFAIEMLDYAVLDNHMHHVLRTRPDLAKTWTDKEIIRRWWKIHPDDTNKDGTPVKLTKRRLDGLLQDKDRIAVWRLRLSSLSWFQKELKEEIANRANVEDEVGGHFWNGRFKCVRLLDLAALLICSMYVDLNVIRAGMASSPEESRHTSIFRRIWGRQHRQTEVNVGNSNTGHAPDAALVPICETGEAGNATAPWHRASDKGFLPMSADDYLSLLDWTGRQRRVDKRGVIPQDFLPILERLRIRGEFWMEAVEQYDKLFYRAVGRVQHMIDTAQQAGRKWLQGLSHCRRIFE